MSPRLDSLPRSLKSHDDLFTLASSLFHLPSSIFHLSSSIFHLPSSTFPLPSSTLFLEWPTRTRKDSSAEYEPSFMLFRFSSGPVLPHQLPEHHHRSIKYLAFHPSTMTKCLVTFFLYSLQFFSWSDQQEQESIQVLDLNCHQYLFCFSSGPIFASSTGDKLVTSIG